MRQNFIKTKMDETEISENSDEDEFSDSTFIDDLDEDY